MSHIRCWEAIAEGSDPYAMVMEDDCMFSPDFVDIFPVAMSQVPRDFHIMYVGCLGLCNKDRKKNDPLFFLSTLMGIRKECNGDRSVCNDEQSGLVAPHVFVPEAPAGLHCYVLSREGAKQFLRRIKVTDRIEGHIDLQMLGHMEDMNVYAVTPNLATQEMSAAASTNLVANYPSLLNTAFSKFKAGNGLGLDYSLSIHAHEIMGIPMNTYALVYLVLGILAGMPYWKMTNQSLASLGWTVVTVFNIAEFVMNPTPMTLKMMIFSQFVFFVGLVVTMTLASAY